MYSGCVWDNVQIIRFPTSGVGVSRSHWADIFLRLRSMQLKATDKCQNTFGYLHPANKNHGSKISETIRLSCLLNHFLQRIPKCHGKCFEDIFQVLKFPGVKIAAFLLIMKIIKIWISSFEFQPLLLYIYREINFLWS